jgi:hypothetical protein
MRLLILAGLLVLLLLGGGVAYFLVPAGDEEVVEEVAEEEPEEEEEHAEEGRHGAALAQPQFTSFEILALPVVRDAIVRDLFRAPLTAASGSKVDIAVG